MANQVVGVDLTDAYSMELKLNTDKWYKNNQSQILILVIYFL